MSEAFDGNSSDVTSVCDAKAVRSQRRLQSARRRRVLSLLVLAAAPLWIVGTDVANRGKRLVLLEPANVLTYAAAFVESSALWACLLYAACRRHGALRHVNAALFVLGLTLVVGAQSYFFDQYNAYINVDVSVFASNFTDSVLNQLLADIGNYARAKLPALGVALALVWAGRRVLRPRGRAARVAGALGPALLVASFFIPTQHRHAQASTPDVLYLHAVGGLLRTQLGFTDESNQLRPRARESLPVPPLSRAAGAPARNVLFVILESVRADSVCVEHDLECQKTRATNLLLPQRFPFRQMRSLDSCTAISLAVLWSGVLPTESRDVLHSWPLIFDYAKAAGYDTAFWTSQNMMFGNSRLWVKNLGVSRFVSATELDPTADLDLGAPEELLAARVIHDIDELEEPFLAVIQLSNVHYPYRVDPAKPMPFQPWSTSKAADENLAFRNHYQNAVYQQDLHVAEVLRHVKSRPFGERTVVVYTSDHGEAFREHGQMGHTFSIFEEEIRVPAFIDAPPGALSAAEVENLRSKRDAYVFHVDLAPTVLDLIGVWDDPAIRRYREKMPGHSLLDAELTLEPLPMTNCAGVWSCAFENWGYMQQSRKLEARSWDTGWKCFDVELDPLEQHPLDPSHCEDLRLLSEKTFGRLPGQGVERR